jgi:hypothetical protein
MTRVYLFQSTVITDKYLEMAAGHEEECPLKLHLILVDYTSNRLVTVLPFLSNRSLSPTDVSQQQKNPTKVRDPDAATDTVGGSGLLWFRAERQSVSNLAGQ